MSKTTTAATSSSTVTANTEYKIFQEETNNKLNKFQLFFFNYGRFHYNIVNILIHICFIPIITITLDRMIFLIARDYLGFKFNPFLFFYLLITPLYVYVDFFSGLITSLQYPLIGFLLKDQPFTIFGFSELRSVVTLHVLAWTVQFFGHGFFENRKPALLENIFLVLNAPVFVTIEFLNFLFKYRDADLTEVREYIKKDIVFYRKSMGWEEQKEHKRN